MKTNTNLDRLIYGKSSIDRIASVEVTEDTTEIFRQLEDGSITSEFKPNKFWILAPKKIDESFVRLKGDLYYKWGKQYTDRRTFLSERSKYKKYNIYTIFNEKEACQIKDGYSYYKNLRPNQVGTLSFDIETSGLLSSSSRTVYLISNTFRDINGITKKLFALDEYNSQLEMLDAWCDWVREMNPSIMLGHNIFGFDLPYLADTASVNGGSLKLGRDGSDIVFDSYTTSYRVDGNTEWDFTNATIYGRELIDTSFVAVKYDIGRNFPSWGLKPITKFLGLEKEDRQHYDASTIKKNWHIPEEREKIKNYAIDDSDDALAIYDVMIPAYYYITQHLPKSFQKVINSATGSWINSFLVRAYLQDAHSIPATSQRDVDVNGGMSYGIPGIYSNVLKWDANSYYPATMLEFKIHPEGKDPNGYFLKMLKHFTDARFDQKRKYKETGDEMYEAMQAASKVFINSSYGMLGTNGLNFNDFPSAAKVTRCCRKGLQKAVIWATNKDVNYWWSDYSKLKTSKDDFLSFDYIDEKTRVKFSEMPRHNWKLVNIDTDSLSFCKEDGSEYTEDEIKMVEKEINDIMYSEWSDDGYFDKVVVLKAKNYILKEKGKDKVKLKGSSITDSKKEPALKEMIGNVIHTLVYDKGKVSDIYEDYIKEACNVFDISRWASKKTISKAVLTSDRTNEVKIRDALNGKDVSEGDKIFVFPDIDGETQAIVKGEPVFYKKNGEPKMIPNRILRLVEDYNDSYDSEHLTKRVYDTINIFKEVVDMNEIICYNTVAGKKLLKDK